MCGLWNFTGKEKSTCIAMATSRPVGLWSNRKCTERNQFVCEYSRKGFTNPPTTTRPTVQPTCPPEWYEFNGFCYKVINRCIVTEQKLQPATSFQIEADIYGGPSVVYKPP